MDLPALTGFTGDAIEPSHPLYRSYCQIFNGAISKHPALILCPRTDEDAAIALAYAQETGQEVAVRGGGHNVAGLALVDDGVVIDFREMRAIAVNAAEQSVRVEPGTIWRELDAATSQYGLATTGGIVSDTGVAGLTLGGGLGWLMGKYGLSCDNLTSAKVLLADGTVVRASANENADLCWALRGGGGNFGIVLEFKFRLYPVSTVYAGSIIFPVSATRSAVRWFHKLGESAPDDLTMSLVGSTTADGVKVVSIDACWLGTEGDGRTLLSGACADVDVITTTLKLRPYIEWQQAFDDPYRRGRRSYWKSLYVTDFSDQFADFFEDAIAHAPSPHTMLTFDHTHGSASRVPSDATAFVHRDKHYLMLVNTNWNDVEDDALNISWTRETFERARKYGMSSVYVNYLSQEGPARVQEAYSSSTLTRLQAVKQRYDPGNVFHANQNIPPLRRHQP